MTNVQQAVARRDEDRSNAPAVVTPQQAVKAQLDQYRPVIGKLLAGTGVSEETFVAQIANACRVNPSLWQCEPATILGAALRAAQLGLAPNDARNLCWIIPYKNQAQFQLGYGGVLELARRAVPGLKFDGRPVYPNDEFDVDFGKAEPLRHRPAVIRQLPRGGEAYAWYVRAVYPDGDIQIQVLDKEGVEYHRKFSKQPNGEMWSKSYDAAALKSVVLDMKRWLPSSSQLVAAFASDERVLHVEEVGTIDADSAEAAQQELEPPSTPPGAAADDGDRQEPASPKSQGEEEPADTDSSGEGASPASDGTVDPTTWTGDEWRVQLGAHKRKVADAIREAQRLAEVAGVDKPAELDNIQANADIAVGLYTWMTTK
jgi:recombination protein RecT